MDRQKFIFLHTKATYFQVIMTTVNEVNNDKTNAPGEFTFRSVSLVCFTADDE